jgi:hypothetical protein
VSNAEGRREGVAEQRSHNNDYGQRIGSMNFESRIENNEVTRVILVKVYIALISFKIYPLFPP